jgi:uncharacterized membrane protein
MRLFGHPLHPMLVHFPIALWAVGSACDVLTLAHVPDAARIAWLSIGAGTAAALLTMTAGMVDYAALDESALPTAHRHMALMGTAWLLYAVAFVFASDGLAPAVEPGWPSIAAALAGFAMLIAGAWQGGQLVYRLGAGVDRRDPR